MRVEKFSRMMAVSLFFVLLSGCAAGPMKKPPGQEVHLGGPAVISLDDFGETERCARVSPGRELQYSFDADDGVVFTIFTVQEDGTRETVSRESTFFTRGTLTPDKETTYCLSWRSRAAFKVRIGYRADIVER